MKIKELITLLNVKRPTFQVWAERFIPCPDTEQGKASEWSEKEVLSAVLFSDLISVGISRSTASAMVNGIYQSGKIKGSKKLAISKGISITLNLDDIFKRYGLGR